MKAFSLKIETAVLSLAFVFVFQYKYNVEIINKIVVGTKEHQDQYFSLKKLNQYQT